MGKVIKWKGSVMENKAMKAKLAAYARGEMTWAEVEGMTFEEAKAIAAVGCDLAAAGRLDDAKVIFEGLVAGNPKDSAARAALGTVYQKLGMTAEALTEYTAALEIDARNPVALCNRGELRLKAGDRGGLDDVSAAANADPHGETASGKRAKNIVRAVALTAVEVARAAQGVPAE